MLAHAAVGVMVPAVARPSSSNDDRVPDAALGALRASGPARPWRARARTLILAVAAMTLAGAVVAAITGSGWWLLKPRLPVLALLLVAQGVLLWAAISPASASGASRLAPLGWLLVMSAAVGVLGGRDLVGTDSSIGWICSLSELGFGLGPLVAVTWSLRDMADDGRRAFTAGLGVATVALFWGELACQRSIGHVLIHHFGAALLLLVAACVLASRRLRRRSFAP
jgi:hypothetical protein